MLLAAIAYSILPRALIALHGEGSTIATAIGSDFKGVILIVIYLAAMLLAVVNPLLSCGLYVVVAVMWLIPDRRLEKTVER